MLADVPVVAWYREATGEELTGAEPTRLAIVAPVMELDDGPWVTVYATMRLPAATDVIVMFWEGMPVALLMSATRSATSCARFTASTALQFDPLSTKDRETVDDPGACGADGAGVPVVVGFSRVSPLVPVVIASEKRRECRGHPHSLGNSRGG